jgi:hypothetical protein
MQDRGVHEDDVGHRDKRGAPRKDLGAPLRAELMEFEVRFELLPQAGQETNLALAAPRKILSRG